MHLKAPTEKPDKNSEGHRRLASFNMYKQGVYNEALSVFCIRLSTASMYPLVVT
jgi:hypothetical protein